MDMKHRHNIYRIDERIPANAKDGAVVCCKTKTLWIISMYMGAIIGGAFTFSISALCVFLLTSAVTICVGHSIGMHRCIVHRCFKCPKYLEYFMAHLGVLVGLGGPESTIRTHDLRDWAQQQSQCHDFFAHRNAFFKDLLWQLFCDIRLEQPPKIMLEHEIAGDRVYQWMQKTWMLQQIPLVLLLFWLGGWPWVVWGTCVRVAVSVTGHWSVVYLVHNYGDIDTKLEGACVQGRNVKFIALICMGECWHNNHHAFPGSAILGFEEGQLDPAWRVLKIMEKFGLVWDLKVPSDFVIKS